MRMTFKERSEKFQAKLVAAQKEFDLEIYPTQAIMQNGELVTLIKLRDLLPPEKEEVKAEKVYEDTTEGRNTPNKKA